MEYKSTPINVVNVTSTWCNDHYENFYKAWIWDDEKGEPVQGPGVWEGFKPNATPEVMAKYNAYLDKKKAEYKAYYDLQEAKRITKGKILKVVRGRKIAKGTIAKCFWVGESGWGTSVGLEVVQVDGTVVRQFTALRNVEVKL